MSKNSFLATVRYHDCARYTVVRPLKSLRRRQDSIWITIKSLRQTAATLSRPHCPGWRSVVYLHATLHALARCLGCLFGSVAFTVSNAMQHPRELRREEGETKTTRYVLRTGTSVFLRSGENSKHLKTSAPEKKTGLRLTWFYFCRRHDGVYKGRRRHSRRVRTYGGAKITT